MTAERRGAISIYRRLTTAKSYVCRQHRLRRLFVEANGIAPAELMEGLGAWLSSFLRPCGANRGIEAKH